jgi:hypothetical protein
MARPVIVPVLNCTLSQAERRAITVLAGEILSEQPKLGVLPPFGADVRMGFGDGRRVIFGDNGEIPLLLQKRPSRLDYRMGFLAGDGDVVVVGGQSSQAFQGYQQSITGARGVIYLNVDPHEKPPLLATPVICLRQPQAFRRLAALLSGGGSPTLMAHITTGTVWALAAKLAEELGKPVYVAGPPPRLSHVVNDKGWFGQVAARLLGQTSIPPKRIAYGAAALTRHVAELADRRNRLFLKVPDSAGSAGNFALSTDELRGMPVRALHGFLTRFLAGSDWSGRYPLLVEVIDANVLTSPSVQLWIPGRREGTPVIEGLFEQTLAGPGNRFTGAVQALLPQPLEQQLTREAQKLGQLFQELGYFGRCSFDAVISGPGWDDVVIHWIECNGRWGGVSIPMSLMNYLDQGAAARAYVIVQSPLQGLQPQPFSNLLAKVEQHFGAAVQHKGLIFLSPNALETGSGLHVLCQGKSRQNAIALSRQLIKFFEQMGAVQTALPTAHTQPG